MTTLKRFPAPKPGQPFYGQDAQDKGYQPHYIDNGNGTITDVNTGLVWTKGLDWDENGVINYKDKMSYREALKWVEKKNKEKYLGFSDWRLPNAKELQSIVDYSRSPDTTNSPAISPIFRCTPIKNEGNKPDYGF